MKLHIKYMISNRCKMLVKEELNKLGLHFVIVDLGEVEIMEELSAAQLDQLKGVLLSSGLELMEDKKAVLIAKIKQVVIEMIYHSDEMINTSFSLFLSEKLQQNYTYLSNLFSAVQGTTIEQFIILHKIERVKELMIYDELNLTEISYKMNYSSVAHLSTQFKKFTGLTPTDYKKMKDKTRIPVEEVGEASL
ncbi:MAG: helix-turn-helix transcriptional regulator [Chitinophagaceae bacterium]|nr:helix-turn-helix transcriptional regulator [Chitinophagaceae bacterium]